MITLIGVYNADGGLVREFFRGLGRAGGAHPCALSHLTHSPRKPKTAWRSFAARLTSDLGHDFVLVHRNQRTPEQLAASAGREPCVLIDDGSGALSMILDWNDLEISEGHVAKFEQILRSKLLMY